MADWSKLAQFGYTETAVEEEVTVRGLTPIRFHPEAVEIVEQARQLWLKSDHWGDWDDAESAELVTAVEAVFEGAWYRTKMSD